MGLLNKDRLLNTGFPGAQAQAIEDQVCGVGNSTPPNSGGSSLNIEGTLFFYADQTGVGNGADTTEDTLKTFTLPANALDQKGRGVRIVAWGNYANNTNTKAAKLYFGSESIAAATGNNVGWRCEMDVLKNAANQQVVSSQQISGTTHGGVTNTTGAETDTAAITIKVTGHDSTSATANSVVLNGMYVTFMN